MNIFYKSDDGWRVVFGIVVVVSCLMTAGGMGLKHSTNIITEKQVKITPKSNDAAGTGLEMDGLISSVRPSLEPAWNYEKDGKLQDAIKIYQDLLGGKPQETLAIFCRQGIMRCREMKAAFSYDREKLWHSLKNNFPDLSRDRFDAYLDKGVFLSRRIEGIR